MRPDMLDGDGTEMLAWGSEETTGSGVSWPAILAGAAAAAAFSLALVALGAGLGLASVSPWSQNNGSPATFGALAGAWFIAVQLFSCGLGGYLAGRLRTRWAGAHVHEVYFRDTAHGLLVWSVSAVVVFWALSSAASHVLTDTTRVGAASMSSRAGASGDTVDYYVDRLFRSESAANAPDAAQQRAEAGRILGRDLRGSAAVGADDGYLADLVAARTGLPAADAQKRVADVEGQARSEMNAAADNARAAADRSRRTGVYIALWSFIALLVGAFAASYMAMVGGSLRDERHLQS